MCAHRIITIGIETAWRHGKSESTPSLAKVFRRRNSRLSFFAKITSAPMSFHFCADGVAVLGAVWIPAAQSKRRSSAGACVDGNWTQLSSLSPAGRARLKLRSKIDGWFLKSFDINDVYLAQNPIKVKIRMPYFRSIFIIVSGGFTSGGVDEMPSAAREAIH